jgi:hypothetical protein
MEGKSQMTQATFYKALKLISIAQNKLPLAPATLKKGINDPTKLKKLLCILCLELPTPTFEGIKVDSSLHKLSRMSEQNVANAVNQASTSHLPQPAIPVDSQAKYQKIFDNVNPKDGLIDGTYVCTQNTHASIH